MKNEELERMIKTAQGYNRPPETPADEMWAVIRAQLPARTGHDELAARRAARGAPGARRWAPWAIGLAAAATLAVGFGLGRLTWDTTFSPRVPAVAGAEPAAQSLPVRLAAAEHMGNAEALLTMFRAGDGAADRAATAEWARDLLATTRLLMDSRVADDPQMAELLNDLELVLVQIANAPANGDQDLIEEGIQRQQLLSKLRIAAAPADISL